MAQDYYYNEHDESQVKKLLKSKKKKRLKRRIKVLLVLVLMFIIVYFLYSDLSKVKSIQVTGQHDLKSEDIIKCSRISKDMYYFMLDKSKIQDDIKAMGMVKKVDVHVNLIGDVVIEIKEADKIAYCEIGNKKYVIDEFGGVKETQDKKVIQSLQSTPRFISFKDEKFLKRFAKEYAQISSLIRNQTSDIIYEPVKGDTTRVKFLMDNGKILYLRVEDMVEQLKKIDYEAFMTTYKNKCVFSFEGKHLYMRDCQ